MATYKGKSNKIVQSRNEYSILTQDMTGKIYKPGRNYSGNECEGQPPKGEWLDKIGKPDLRIMAMSKLGQGSFYKVYNSAHEFFQDWDITDLTGHSERIKQGFAKL